MLLVGGEGVEDGLGDAIEHGPVGRMGAGDDVVRRLATTPYALGIEGRGDRRLEPLTPERQREGDTAVAKAAAAAPRAPNAPVSPSRREGNRSVEGAARRADASGYESRVTTAHVDTAGSERKSGSG